jgi:excinuclease UvrABC ATPase subunit
MTIREENRNTLLIVKHDPMLNEDADKMVELHSSGPEAGLTGSHHSDIRLR